MRFARVCFIGIVSMAIALSAGVVRAESMHVFGVHNWEWGADLDVMSWRSGWITEANLSKESPNVGGRYAPMVGEGFSIVQRLDWEWDETIPLDPTNYATFASNCRNWAKKIKPYCRHYSIGNEVDLTDVTPSQYAVVFQQVRNAILAEQPEAKVLVGHWCSIGNVRSVVQMLGPGNYDGLTSHAGSSVPDDLCELLNDENAPANVGVHITEWGWVAGTNPNSEAVMLQFCQDINEWNATHDRQVYSATWYRYPCWDPTFSLECTPLDNAAFENMTLNCAATNAYADNPVTILNPRVEVSATDKALVARWETDHPAQTMLWYWNEQAAANNGEFIPLQTSLVYDHEIVMDSTLYVQPEHEYIMVCRSPVWDMGNGNTGPLRVTTGPWTVQVTNITPSTALVSWETMFASSSRVEFGHTTDYGLEQIGPDGVTNHTMQLLGLRPAKTYHLRVWSEADGYAAHHSEDYAFRTADPTDPFIEVWPYEISTSGQALTHPPNAQFYLSNAGPGTIHYTITPECSWLTASPDHGDSADDVDVITLSYDTSQLGAGVHTCQLRIEAPEAINSPVLAPIVTLSLSTIDTDFDEDGDVDQADFGHLQSCLTGPGDAQNDPACLDARLDEDNDVDHDDFAILQACMSGSDVAPDPSCAD